ncbi:MAG: tRNA (adenosine(37)-N6)-dimethylallyltransferase MiaA [Phycisphaeraceae bacterium]
MDAPRPIVIFGPTAGGKSELAVRLAEELGGEVLGADSMQVYRRLDAGTAKPEPALRQRAAHHLIDIVEPTEPFSAADWLARADGLIEALRGRGVVPIVVGGTNLYLKLLLEGMFEGPGQDPAFRETLEGAAGEKLHAELERVDPESAARIHPNNHKRLVRALEVFHLTGTPISELQRQWGRERADRPYRHDPVLLGLRWAAEAINPRINLRVRAMFYPDKVDPKLAASVCIGGESLPEETRRLESAGWLGVQAREALGYKQVLRWVHGQWSLDEAFEQTKVQTRRFAKQQRTWLRRFRGVSWLDAAELAPEARAQAALAAVRAEAR